MRAGLGNICCLLTILAPISVQAQAPETNDWELKHKLGLEYRTQFVGMRPLSLNDLTAEKLTYFDQRARINSAFLLSERVSLKSSIDLLDGVVFGDNGIFTGSPKRNRGSVVGSKGPNLSRLNIGQLNPDMSALDLDNYGYILEPADPVIIRSLFGEAVTPIGLIRAGRQPISNGRNILVHDGSRINRWGISKAPDVVDGIAFGTKLSAIYDYIRGSEIDDSQANGLFMAASPWTLQDLRCLRLP